MAFRHWFTGGVVAVLSSVVVSSLGGPAMAESKVPGGGGSAHAGAVPGISPRISSQTDASLVADATVGGVNYSVTGIDVSSHDHINYAIDWTSVAAGGVNFAYIKATEGTPKSSTNPDGPYVNPYFRSDFDAAKANGLYAGAYAFGRPDLGDPVGQANVLVDESGWTPDNKTLIPMLDMEGPYGTLTSTYEKCWNPVGQAASTAAIVSWIRSFVTQVQVRTGRPPMLYTSAGWWNQCTGSNTSFGNLPLNVANWQTTTQPTLPAGWSTFTIWQYAEGNNSVQGNYDKDVFNGDLTALSTVAGGSSFTPAGPTRILDTRYAIGVSTKTAVPAGGTVKLQVTGASGVPATGVTSVVLNVTVTSTTGYGLVTVYPDGQPKPNASNLNWVAGNTIANLVTVPVINGKVDLTTAGTGSAHLIADLAGYYSTGSGSRFTPTGPTRILDTRYAIGVSTKTAVAPYGTVKLKVAGVAGVPSTGVTSVVMNVTVTSPTTMGYLTVYPDGQSRPNASNIDWVKGQTIPNLVTARVVNGVVDLYNGSSGTVHFIADLAGYFSASGSRFTPVGPTRVLDTRSAIGVSTTTPVAAYGTVKLKVAGVAGVPSSGATSVVMNVTVTAGTNIGYLTAYPDGQARPTASNLNWVKGQTIPNLVTARTGGGIVDLYNGSSGTVHVISDLAGYYY